VTQYFIKGGYYTALPIVFIAERRPDKMKKLIVMILAAFVLVFALAPAAYAGGAPPSDAMKGTFTSVDMASRTAVFQPVDDDEPITLKLDESITRNDVKLDNRVMVTLSDEGGTEVVTDIQTMFIGMTVGRIFALLIVGFVGGMLSGFIGSGGAFVLTPSMMSLGAPGAVAVASNMAHKFPKAMVGTYKRYRYGQVDIRLGLVMAGSAILGVQLGIRIQKMILNTWGSVGSDLYVSFVFVIILVLVGSFVLKDAIKGAKNKDQGEEKNRRLALAMQKIKIPPMIYFKKADVRLSMWVVVPIGFCTGMLAATIAVGGFIGVPGMIYLVGATAIVASATELLVAFVMGFWGSIQWALSGLVDIRMTLLILAASLFGVQLGAVGTTYVKDYSIKLVMAAVMLIVAVSRGVKIPVYLDELGVVSVSPNATYVLNSISFWALVTALGVAGLIISSSMIKGIMRSRVEEREAAAAAEGA
jgi:uncharacterized membrane protein YfcA